MERTAAATLNLMQPLLLSALRVIPVEGTEVLADAVHGRFGRSAEFQAILELPELVGRFAREGSVFLKNHGSTSSRLGPDHGAKRAC